MRSCRVFLFIVAQVLFSLATEAECHPLEQQSLTPSDENDYDLNKKEDPKEKIILSKEDVKNLVDIFLEWFAQNGPPIRHHNHHHHHSHQQQIALETDIEDGPSKVETSTVDHEMQGDQPLVENNNPLNGMQADAQSGTPSNVGINIATSYDQGNLFNLAQENRMIRERRDLVEEDRDKGNRINYILELIRLHTGRDNSTRNATPDDPKFREFARTMIPTNFSFGNASLMGKMSSSYPSCDLPKNIDMEVWRDENVLNLYFPFEVIREENATIATATLRLYRLFQETNSSSSSVNDVGCETVAHEEDKLLRVSVFWYTKALKRHRVRRRLCDSKVVSESNPWVELNIWHATRAWSKGKNLGLAVTVEDQEQDALQATKYFKGPTCTQPPSRSIADVLDEITQIQPFMIAYLCPLS